MSKALATCDCIQYWFISVSPILGGIALPIRLYNIFQPRN